MRGNEVSFAGLRKSLEKNKASRPVFLSHKKLNEVRCSSFLESSIKINGNFEYSGVPNASSLHGSSNKHADNQYRTHNFSSVSQKKVNRRNVLGSVEQFQKQDSQRKSLQRNMTINESDTCNLIYPLDSHAKTKRRKTEISSCSFSSGLKDLKRVQTQAQDSYKKKRPGAQVTFPISVATLVEKIQNIEARLQESQKQLDAGAPSK